MENPKESRSISLHICGCLMVLFYDFCWRCWLCGDLVFGSVPCRLLLLPPPPPPAAHLSSHNLLTHNLQLVIPQLVLTTRSHTTCPHTTCHHTTCHHTTCHHTTCHHTSCHHTTCSHTLCCSPTCLHTTCPHTTGPHTTCTQTHTTCPHTTCPHITCYHTTCPTCSHATWSHTTCCPHTTCPTSSHTTCLLTQLVHTQAPVARLGRSGRGGRRMSPRLLAWQACHFETSTFVSHGRRGAWWHGHALCVAGMTLMALGWLWWRAWEVGGVDAAAFCVAGKALGDMDLPLCTWHLATCIFTLRGSCGTYGVGLAPMARLGRSGRRGFLRGRRGTWWHGLALCVAGVALGDMDHRFAWQAWHFWHWALVGRSGQGGRRGFFAWQAWHLLTWTCTLRGRHGTWWHGRTLGGRRGTYGTGLWWRTWAGVDGVDAASFCVAGVALGDMDLHFAWQAWHLATCIFTLRGSCGAGRGGRRGFLRGRRGTWWHGLALCVAGVALGDMDRQFAWQAWHLRHWAGSGGALGSQLHNLSTHHLLTHNLLAQLCHIQCFHTQRFYIHKLTRTTLSRTALSPNLPCTISFPSCLSHLVFTSVWWSLEEVDLWGYPVL